MILNSYTTDNTYTLSRKNANMNTDILLKHSEINPRTVNSKLRKNLPFILGAATVVAGTFFIRSWVRRSKNHDQKETEQQENPSAGITTKSIVVQLLPIATLFLKNWLTKSEPEKETATA